MASAIRQLPEEAVSDPIKTPKSSPSARVVLNPADCDLDFNVESNGLVGYGLHERGFAYCWSGARANVGITRGRYCFSCKVVSEQPVNMQDTDLGKQHVCRLGVSRGDDVVGNLGESKHSFGYGGTGKFSNAGKFTDFGQRFGVGDTIVCCIDLENKPMASIGFSKNGKWLGTAIQFDAGCLGLGVVDSPLQLALFPHVLLKNVVVRMQFSPEDGLVPEEGFKPWSSAIEDRTMIMGPTFSDPRDCEVIMMVGLPASGKTTWAEKWVKAHPEKRYVLLGTNLILDHMKVPGLLRKNNYGERFDRLMDQATGIFNEVLSRAARKPRNYIIDQTNVYKNARKRKLKPFADFKKIAVVVFPKPDELKIRSNNRFREMGKEVPPDALNKMIENYVLPTSKDMHYTDEYFDQVMFVELNQDESQKYLDQMKHDLASIPNNVNNPPIPSSGGSFQSFGGSSLQHQGSLTGMDIINWRGSHLSDTSPGNYGMPTQVNINDCVTERHHGSMNSFSGTYPYGHIPPMARATRPCGPYPNNESSFPRDNTCYNRTCGVIPTQDIKTYTNSAIGSHYSRPNIVGNSMVFPDPYNRSYSNETLPIANASTMPLSYGRPYNDNRGFRPTDLRAPSLITNDSVPPYGTPRPRPPHGSLPDYKRFSGGHPSQRPRYQ